MKGVVLAGGLGTRLYPLTYATNKHLLPVYDKPMVFYPIETLVKAGITEVMVVTGGPYAGHFIRVLKNGKELGLENLAYAYQEDEGGIAAALSLAREFADGDKLAVILGDNTTDADISKAAADFSDGALVFLKKYKDKNLLKRFGVPVFDKSGEKILKMEEKPSEPKSMYAQTGLYLYDETVFAKINNLSPSSRGELEVSDLNSLYAKEGRLYWSELKGFWSDAGTVKSLFKANKFWFEKQK
jgi:glucose-1-phosphate thymidylyltransferase